MVLGVIQIAGLLFLIFAASRIYLRYKDKKLDMKAALVWIILWIILAWFLVFTQSTNVIADKFGLSRGADLIVYVSIVLIYYLLFKLYIKLDETNKSITKIVRELALEKKR